MESYFNQPQRQSSVGILVMFFDTIQHYARALWPILVIWILKFDEINKLYLTLGTIAVFIVIGVVAYLKYLNFTFYLDRENQEFVINEGIFNKTKTTIQLHKIQQVNINQSLIQRAIGVYALDVDTAGSTAKEGKIKAISQLLALELKSCLLDNQNIKSSQNTVLSTKITPFQAEQPFIKISFLSLLKMGITSNYVRSFSPIIFSA